MFIKKGTQSKLERLQTGRA